jgi:hypothetical protein
MEYKRNDTLTRTTFEMRIGIWKLTISVRLQTTNISVGRVLLLHDNATTFTINRHTIGLTLLLIEGDNL